MKILTRSILWGGILLLVTFALLYFVNTQTVLRWVISQATEKIPGDVHIGNVQGRLFGPIKLTDVRFDDDDLRLDVAQIDMQWHPASLLYGRLHIASLLVNDVNITLEDGRGDSFNETVDNWISLLPSIPIDMAEGTIRKLSIRDTPSGQNQVIDEIRINGSSRLNKITLGVLNVYATNYSLMVSGSVSPKSNLEIDAIMEWDWHPQHGERVFAKAKFQGDATLLNVSMSVEQPSLLQFKGEIENVMADVKWRGKLISDNFNYAAYIKVQNLDTTAVGPLNGVGQLNGTLESVSLKGNFSTFIANIGNLHSQLDITLEDKTLRINQAIVTQDDSLATVKVQGLLSFADASWQFDGKTWWQDIQWPLTGPVELSSQAGEIAGKLTENHYDLALSHIMLQYDGHTLNDLSTRAEGNYQGLEFSALSTRVYDGTINGTGKIAWKSGLSWQASLQGNNINPGYLHAKWPGTLSISLKSQGKVIANNMDAQIQVDSSEGILKGQAFSGHGDIRIHNDTFSSTGLNFTLGDAVLKLAGGVGTEWDLSWDLKRADVAWLFPHTNGTFGSEGIMIGARRKPLVRARLKGTGIENDQQQKIDALSANINMDFSGNKESMLDLRVEGLQNQDYRLDSLQLKANGEPKHHQIKLTAQAGNDKLRVTMAGAYANEQWQGKISDAKLHTELAGDWKMLSGARLKVSQKLFELMDACWVNNQARWCASSHWQKDQSIASRFKFERVPLSLFQPLVKNQFQFQGELNGSAELHIRDQKIYNANIDLSVSEGSVNMVVDKESTQISNFQNGTLAYTQAVNQTVGNFAIHFSEQESLTVAIKLTRPDDPSIVVRDWPVAGYVKANMQHLGFIRLFFSAIHDISGYWRSDIKLHGSLGKPKISGYSTIVAPLITLPTAGLAIKDTNLSINSVGENSFEITGGFLSGNGSVDIDGHLLADPQQGWPIQINLSGDHLQVYNIDESEVEISPELEFKVAGERVDINGRIEISKADITIDAAISDSIEISRDVVFVDEPESVEDPKAGKTQNQASRLKVYSNVKYTLSDNVYFDGYGLNGKLTGSVDVKAEPGKAATGQGALHIKDGRFKAFGISLDMDIGRLIFDNDPVANPAINARASKRSGDITAGVRITGYLTAPEVSVYSIPSMPENEVISYLLFGKLVNDTSFGSDAFNTSGGQSGGTGGSLNLGDALNPGSYIDYAVGLLSSTSVLRVRFEINKNWEVNTESSATYRGAEVVYTFER